MTWYSADFNFRLNYTSETLTNPILDFLSFTSQALNNLGSIYVDCDKLDLAANCYMNALNIKHTRAHQGLARVYHLKNQRKSAYDEMTRLIEKAKNNASAYEKRSEYCDRDMARSDLAMATQLDPVRTYPYRYRAASKSQHQTFLQ